MRSLFGLRRTKTIRTVVGARESIDIKEIRYIQDSKNRLASLHQLHNRYKNTLHASKIKAVYDKTRLIHHFLVSRNRAYELELFHLQHTDHFISAFSVIMDVHEKPYASSHAPSDAQPAPEFTPPAGHEKGIAPALTVPAISINTIAKIAYTNEEDAGELSPKAMIGYVSTKEEKDVFLRHVSARLGLGLEDISYVGNTSINLPGNKAGNRTPLLPVIHWRAYLYALDLNDYRLFPVQIYRRGL